MLYLYAKFAISKKIMKLTYLISDPQNIKSDNEIKQKDPRNMDEIEKLEELFMHLYNED